ncbi:MAG TPA: recombinase family protein [Candidatus Acidoferrales bacterium]|nr:recombinase family protein [Candidatus Acidoferrales bacterium]
MLTAAIYARYSSDRQRATSIEDQVAQCHQAAPRLGYTVLEDQVYADQEISGAVEQRPGYTRLMNDAKNRRFAAILVESQDRLWRDQGEMHHALKRLRFWGVRVIAVTTGTDLTDRAGRLVASVMGWKDEAFLEDLRDKTRRGMAGQVRRGLSAGGRAYGYRSEPVYDEGHQIVGYRRVVSPQEASVVKRIFELYDAGYSPKTIVHMLNVEGVTPPRPSRGRRLMGWTWTTINGSAKRAIGILNNPLYIGRIAWNRSQKVRDPDTDRRMMRPRSEDEWQWTEVPDLRIVPQDLWDRVQARRQGQRHESGLSPGRKPKYLFSGLLVCAECGSHYIIKDRGYYACSANVNRGPAVCRNTKLARRDRVEEILTDCIFTEVFSPEAVTYLARQVDEAIARLSADPGEQRHRLEANLRQAKTELENVLTAIRQGLTTPATRGLLFECEQRVDSLETALKNQPSEPLRPISLPSVVEGYLRELKATMKTDVERARTLLAKLIGPVVLRREGRRLVAEVRGNLEALLELDSAREISLCGGNRGAGRGI